MGLFVVLALKAGVETERYKFNQDICLSGFNKIIEGIVFKQCKLMIFANVIIAL